MIFMLGEKENSRASTKEHEKNTKTHFDHCNGPSKIFCNVCETFIPEKN